MDFKILATLLSEQTKNKILDELSNKDSIEKPFLVREFLIVSEFLAQSTNEIVFPTEDFVRVVRMNLRIGNAISDTKWVTEFQSNDLVINYYQKILDDNGNIEEIKANLQNDIEQFDPESDPEGLIGKLSLLAILVLIQAYQGELDLCRKSVFDAQAICQKVEGNKLAVFVLGQILTTVGWWERERGDILEAERLQNELLDIANSLNSEILLGNAYGLIGAFYSQLGSIKKAMSNYQKSREIRESLGDKIRALNVASSMAWDIMALGKPNDAIQLLEEIRDDHSKLNGPENIPPAVTRFLGEIFLLNGDLEKSYKYIKEAWDKRVQLSEENTYGINVARKSLIEIQIERGKLNEAKLLLDKLFQYCQSSPTDYLSSGYYLSLSNYHLKKYNLGLALEKIFEALKYASKPGNYDILLKSQLTITKIYMQEYKLSENNLLLIKALNFIENIIQATKEQEYSFLLWRSLIIRSNIEFLLEKRLTALNTLEEALLIVKDDPDAKQIISENIADLESKIKEQTKSEYQRESILRRISKNIQEAFKFVFVKKPVEVKYIVHGLMIIKDSGLPLYSKILDEKIIGNDMLLTGLISAISTFSTQIFTGTNTGALSSIVHENLVILLEKHNEILFALLVDKNTFELRNRMLQFIQDLPIRFSDDPEEQKMNEMLDQKFQLYFSS